MKLRAIIMTATDLIKFNLKNIGSSCKCYIAALLLHYTVSHKNVSFCLRLVYNSRVSWSTSIIIFLQLQTEMYIASIYNLHN